MHSFSALAATALILTIAKSAVVTQIDYVTKYAYEQVDILVDTNGTPYSTVTSTVFPSSESSRSGSHSHQETSLSISNSPLSHSVASLDVPVTSTFSSLEAPTTRSSPSTITSSTKITSKDDTSTYEPTAYSTQKPDTTSSHPSTLTSQPSTHTSQSSTTTTHASTTSSQAPESSQFSGSGTYYDVGLGACGNTNTNSELIAALNKDQWDQFGTMSNGNPVCGRTATLHYQGKSVTVTIQDKCMGCKYGDVDLSPAAFEKLADKSLGRIPITWSFN